MAVAFKHYKGDVYEKVCLAADEATGELMTVYKSIETGHIYVRPDKDFNGNVEIAPGKWVERFELIYIPD